MPAGLNVFVSYCRRDVTWLERLRVHLTPLERSGQLVLWDDSRLAPGDAWRTEISNAIDTAAAAVLLLSADFLASAFIASDELPRLLHKAKVRGARILPIYVQPCRLGHPALAELQALNSSALPLSKLSAAEAEDVFVRVAVHLEEVLQPTRPGRAVTIVGEGAGEQLYAELKFGVIALSMLRWLTVHDSAEGRTLSELSQLNRVRSRHAAFDALQRMVQAGWLLKVQRADKTAYLATVEGRRQLRRIDIAADASVCAP